MTPVCRWPPTGVKGAVVAAVVAALAGCAVGPDYVRPTFETTPAYKEAGDWKPSEPADALNRGPWWRVFSDAELDGLETQINISNENVRAAAAAFDQARALVAQAQAGFWPTIAASFGRQRGNSFGLPTETTNTAGVSANWDLDVWGSIRRTAESFIWDAPPAWAGRRDDPRCCGDTRHIYNIVCEPPCYRCGSCQGCWHG